MKCMFINENRVIQTIYHKVGVYQIEREQTHVKNNPRTEHKN